MPCQSWPVPRTGRPANRHVASVSRAVQVLSALAAGDPELGTNELARRTGVNASTVSRLLATLVAAGLVEHVAEGGRYRLGIRLLHLGNTVLERLDLREIARPHLKGLVATTDETATLAIPGDRAAVMIDFIQGGASVQSVAQVGRPSVAHATATGKVMLAFGGGAMPSARLDAYTPRTITDPHALAAELDRVRVRGWAQAVGEREEDLNAIATPLWDRRREVAGILGVQGPASRFRSRRMRAALAPLRERAETISLTLGWQPGS